MKVTVKKRYLLLGLLGIAVLAGGVFYAARTRSISDQPIASSGGSLDINVQIDGLPYWLQNDPAWGNELIGGSNESMAGAGCTVTCVAMALSSLGYQATPLDLCRELKTRNGFTQQGYVIWGKIGELTGGAIGVEFPALTHDALDDSLRAGRPVITKIMLGRGIPHWVLLVGKQGSEYLVMDPLNVDKTLVRLSSRSAQIYAIRVLRRE